MTTWDYVMALLLTMPPTAEPVSLAEAKAYLRVDGDDEDALLATLIASARTTVERSAGLALLTQGWSLLLDQWPARGALALPLWPVQSVGDIELRTAAGNTAVLSADAYLVDAVSRPARIVLTGSPSPISARVVNGIEVGFVAGFGDAADDVPAPIRQALLMLVAHGFERREPVVAEGQPQELPMTVASLLAPYRDVRL